MHIHKFQKIEDEYLMSMIQRKKFILSFFWQANEYMINENFVNV
jgi:hypothetical protein